MGIATASTGASGVRATVLQLALIAAAVANSGTTMLPYLVRDVRGPDLALLERTVPRQLGTALSTAAASALARAMRTAATRPDCSGCAMAGSIVHALSAPAASSPAVTIAFSGRIAVAVVVEKSAAAKDGRHAAIATALAVLKASQQVP